MSVEELNNLIFERLGYVDKYIEYRRKLDAHLSLANLCISKAKTTRGISLFSVNSIISHDLEPSVFIQNRTDKFALLPSDEDDNDKNSQKDESGKAEDVKEKQNVKSQYRPFGVLEPSSAKYARTEMKSAIEIICKLATIGLKINQMNVKVQKLLECVAREAELAKKLRDMYMDNDE